MKTFIYKDRFFMEDEDFDSVDYFSASITDDDDPDSYRQLSLPYASVEIGGGNQEGVCWGFSLRDKQDREVALETIDALRSALDRFYNALKEECEKLDEKLDEKE